MSTSRKTKKAIKETGDLEEGEALVAAKGKAKAKARSKGKDQVASDDDGRGEPKAKSKGRRKKQAPDAEDTPGEPQPEKAAKAKRAAKGKGRRAAKAQPAPAPAPTSREEAEPSTLEHELEVLLGDVDGDVVDAGGEENSQEDDDEGLGDPVDEADSGGLADDAGSDRESEAAVDLAIVPAEVEGATMPTTVLAHPHLAGSSAPVLSIPIQVKLPDFASHTFAWSQPLPLPAPAAEASANDLRDATVVEAAPVPAGPSSSAASASASQGDVAVVPILIGDKDELQKSQRVEMCDKDGLQESQLVEIENRETDGDIFSVADMAGIMGAFSGISRLESPQVRCRAKSFARLRYVSDECCLFVGVIFCFMVCVKMFSFAGTGDGHPLL